MGHGGIIIEHVVNSLIRGYFGQKQTAYSYVHDRNRDGDTSLPTERLAQAGTYVHHEFTTMKMLFQELTNHKSMTIVHHRQEPDVKKNV